MRYQHPVTPAERSPTLALLCEHLVPRTVPFYVDVTPLPSAQVYECFPLVEAHSLH